VVWRGFVVAGSSSFFSVGGEVFTGLVRLVVLTSSVSIVFVVGCVVVVVVVVADIAMSKLMITAAYMMVSDLYFLILNISDYM